MAVIMSRFCRLWLLANDELAIRTIFSSSSISSDCSPAAMNALTATETCSGLRHSGSAVETTWSTRGLRPSDPSASTLAHSSASARSTT